MFQPLLDPLYNSVAVDRSQRRREMQYVMASLVHSFGDDSSRLDSVEDEQTWSLLLTDPCDQFITVQRFFALLRYHATFFGLL